jgi:hypothetical protein
MLWYAYIYYTLFNIVLLSLVFYLFRLLLLNSLTRVNSFLILNRLFLSVTAFLLLLTMVILNSSLLYYQDLVYIGCNFSGTPGYLGLFTYDNFIPITSTNLNLIQVYYYPFLYVFLFVTTLSIVFCLSYNVDELISFMFYCQVILISGYTLFFADSLVIFFLSYEMLLIPSFFILYKFAKTRRCVEAAYLMFF